MTKKIIKEAFNRMEKRPSDSMALLISCPEVKSFILDSISCYLHDDDEDKKKLFALCLSLATFGYDIRNNITIQ